MGGEAEFGTDTYAPDGPAEHEVRSLPDQNLLSVADAPGVGKMHIFPFIFMARFFMRVIDRHTGEEVARVTYGVLIVKRTGTEMRNQANKITVRTRKFAGL